MDGEFVKFNLPTFQSPIMAMYCELCDKMWAAEFESPTCVCEDLFVFEPNIYNVVLSFQDVVMYYRYYDGSLPKMFWNFQLIPFWAFLMNVCPKWIDFP